MSVSPCTKSKRRTVEELYSEKNDWSYMRRLWQQQSKGSKCNLPQNTKRREEKSAMARSVDICEEVIKESTRDTFQMETAAKNQAFLWANALLLQGRKGQELSG